MFHVQRSHLHVIIVGLLVGGILGGLLPLAYMRGYASAYQEVTEVQ